MKEFIKEMIFIIVSIQVLVTISLIIKYFTSKNPFDDYIDTDIDPEEEEW